MVEKNLSIGQRLFYRNGFGQVPGPIYIPPFVYGDVIGQQLQRYRYDDWGQTFGYFRYFQAIIGQLRHGGIPSVDDGHYRSTTRLDLLNVAYNLVVQRIARGDDYRWHLCVDQCDGAVFHLCGSVSLGMDVRDLFQFQSTFERRRVVVSPSQI